MALPRGEVVTVHVGGSALLVTQNLGSARRGAKADAPPYLKQSPVRTRLIHRGLTKLRTEHPARLWGWSAGPAFNRWRFRHAVGSYERGDVGLNLVQPKNSAR